MVVKELKSTKYGWKKRGPWWSKSQSECSRSCHFLCVQWLNARPRLPEVYMAQWTLVCCVIWVGNHSHQVLHAFNNWGAEIKSMIWQLLPTYTLSDFVELLVAWNFGQWHLVFLDDVLLCLSNDVQAISRLLSTQYLLRESWLVPLLQLSTFPCQTECIHIINLGRECAIAYAFLSCLY